MIVSRFITDGAKTNGRLIRHRRALRKTTSRAYCSKRSVTQCVRVRIESGGGEGWGREPIEIALDCRVQITRRHLQIAAFKPHADTRPLTIPTREIKLIRTFGQRSSTNRKIIAFSFFLSLFVSFRGKEWRRNCVDLTINYWTECISILREKLKKKDWKRFRDKYIERSVRSCNFPMDIRIKEIVGWIVNF